MNNLKFILIPSSLVAILFYIYSYFLFPEYLDEVPGEFDAINGYKKNAWTSQKSTSEVIKRIFGNGLLQKKNLMK